MLQLLTGQCSLGFTILQTVIGSFVGSLSFVANMLIMGTIYRKWQAYQATKAQEHGQRTAEQPNRADRRHFIKG